MSYILFVTYSFFFLFILPVGALGFNSYNDGTFRKLHSQVRAGSPPEPAAPARSLLQLSSSL